MSFVDGNLGTWPKEKRYECYFMWENLHTKSFNMLHIQSSKRIGTFYDHALL